MNTKEIIKYLKTTISEKGEYCYSLSKQTTKAIIKHIDKQEEEIERLQTIIKEVRKKLDTQLAFTSSYQLNYQSAMIIIEETKQILDKENI